MTSIRLTQFAGLMPELSAKLKRKDNAQIAHNCLLYDGKLRAMPAYFQYNTLPQAPLSMFRALQGLGAPINGRVQWDYQISEAIYVDGAPFAQGLYGISDVTPYTSSYIAARFGPSSVGFSLTTAGIPAPVIISSPVVSITASGFQAVRPNVVGYAITSIRDVSQFGTIGVQESAPTLLGIVGYPLLGNLWYEGDSVTISAPLRTLESNETAFRLYRTITAIESGEQLVNTFDTDWNLVATVPIVDSAIPVFSYIDNSPTQFIPGDLLLSKNFQCPNLSHSPINFGITESGWFWATTNYEVIFSERYLSHAWPIANYLAINQVDTIVDATGFYDNVFLGTAGRPYRVNVQSSDDDTLHINAYPFPEHQPCLSGTLVTAPFGALYTSVNGVVSLEENRMQVITRDLLNGGNILYHDCNTEFKFQDITRAAWFNGWYIGYAPNGKIFVYQAPEDLNDVHPFQQLITMDGPVNAAPGPWAIGDYGLQIAYGTDLYYWPVPGWVRPNDNPQKLCYKWKSKKFVFPGITTFAAAKVVWDCDGEVCFKLIGDCRHIYERKVTNCNPFRLPHNWRHIEFEIEVTGTGSVSEIHVASSMQELTEVNTE